ncbi:hypothetical protein FB451DRAFT_161242 [Mycena latifolia]|nr:hypothetical protein FB451DRAFT_161242 [Mycena latifolia]
MHAQLASTPRVRSGDPDAILGPLLSRRLLRGSDGDLPLSFSPSSFRSQAPSTTTSPSRACSPPSLKVRRVCDCAGCGMKSAKNAPEKRAEERPRRRKTCARQNMRTNTNAAHTAHATGAITRRIRAVLCACGLWCRPRSARSTVRGHAQVGADGEGGGRSFEDSFDASPVLSAHASDASPESLLFGPTPLHSDFPPRMSATSRTISDIHVTTPGNDRLTEPPRRHSFAAGPLRGANSS